uniref:YHYH domain-containing protein n=1 Tax=Globisporangium ultimum (strain ATCC 200006 / CBS 805.95 / DAOM BR144) TaxID=431595 RepID=K3WAD3_GLOUD
FQGTYIDVAGSPYTLRYTTDLVLPGGSEVETNPFTVAAGVCNNLVLLNTSVEATGGKAFAIQPVLKLVDSGGNILEEDSSSMVRVAISSNPSDGVLSPSQSLKAYVRHGVAIFRSLKIDRAGNDYSLVFTLYTRMDGKLVWAKTEIEKVSPPFNIIIGRPVTLFLQQNLSDSVLDGQPNEHQPILALLDAGGNVVSSIVSGSVTATLISSAGIASSIVVDTSVALLITVVSVKALPTPLHPMPYGVGMRLFIEVTFSDEVLVLGMPTLTLATSTTGPNGVAECVTLNTWTTKVVFQYDIALTDSSTDLNYLSTSALSLNGGTIQDRNMRTPTLTLPDLASAQSLAGKSSVVIDTTAPVILSVSSTTPGDGEYGIGEEIYIKMLFSRPTTVYGNPLLPLALTTIGNGASIRNAVFFGGNNTDTLVFLYVVQNGDATATVLDVTANIDTNGGFIKHYSSRPTTDVIPAMATAPSNLASLNSIVIDTSTPMVNPMIGVTSSASNGVYAPGDEIEIMVTFTKPVSVQGYPRLYLETGSVKRPAGYKSGHTTKSLKFVYTIAAYDIHLATGNAHLNYRDDNALDLNGGSIKRYIQRGTGASNAVLSLTAATTQGKSLMNNAQIDLDGVPPTVLALSIVSAPSGNVIRGDLVVIGISFSSRVIVDTTRGIPSLQLYVGEYNRQAIYTSGSGTLALLFTYQVSLGDRAPDGLDYRSSHALLLNLGIIRRASMTPILDADLTLPEPTLTLATPPVLVDPTVGFVTTIQSLTADVPTGEYGSNHVITLTVKFTDEVAVDGITLPVLKMNTNALVEYISGSQTNELKFIYIVHDGDYAANFDKFDDASLICDLPGCSIINYNGEPVGTSLAGVTLLPANIVIDTAPPVVVSVYSLTSASTINGNSFVVGDEIDIVVEMSHGVFIEPPPSAYPEKAPILVLNTVPFGRDVLCRGYFQDNRKLLLFKYVVDEGDVSTDLKYVDENSLTLNSGQSAIKRFATTPKTDAILTLPYPPAPLGAARNQVLTIDTRKVPSVVSVFANNADGLYRCGDVLELVVTFTQHVVVIGAPLLWLDLGTYVRKAVYSSGSGSTVLTFVYAVQDGDYSIDLEYVDHHSLDASDESASISHLSTNPTTLAILDLPYPYTQQSLSFNNNLVVNGRKPTILSTVFLSPDGKYSVGQTILLEATFSTCVTIDFGANNQNIPLLRFQPSGITSITRYGVYVSGSPGTKLRFEYTILTGDTSKDLDYADSKAIILNGARILTCPTSPTAVPIQNADLHLNPPGGRLLGVATKEIIFGMVRYTDLAVDHLGFGYQVAFRTQIGTAVLETSSSFDVLYSACYGLRSVPYASGDRSGASADIDGDILVLGAPGASEPISAIQIVTALGESSTYVDEIQTITTSATQQSAIQEITTSAAPGETLGGWFHLQIGSIGPTRKLYYNFDEIQLRVALELDLGFGSETIRVTRQVNTYCACSEAFIWTITFMYVEGPLAALTAINRLTGRGATVGDGRGASQARILVESTAISGFFTLQVANLVTRNIKYNVDEGELSAILVQDLNLPIRSISRRLPTLVHGYTWSITFIASDALYDVQQLVAQSAGLLGYKAQ